MGKKTSHVDQRIAPNPEGSQDISEDMPNTDKTASRVRLVTLGSIALFVATSIVNLGSFAFHLVVSRQLDTSAYGALGALVGLMFVFTVPSMALQVAITREVAARRGSSDKPIPVIVGPLLAKSVIWGIAATLLLVACSPLLKNFLHLPTLMSAVLLAVYVLPITIELVPKAVLLGETRFGIVSVSIVAGAVLRLALAYPMSHARGVDGAMAATVLGAVITPLVLLIPFRSLIHSREGEEPLAVHWSDGMSAIVAFAGYWLLISADTVMARHYLSRSDSGLYAAASVAARCVMFLPGAVATIAFPSFAKAKGTAAARRALLQSAAVVTAIGLAAAIGFIVFPNLVIGTLFPDSYSSSTKALGILAVASAAVGTSGLLMHFHLSARSRMGASLCWIGIASVVVGSTLFHDSVEQIAVVTLVSNCLVFVLMAWPIFFGATQGRDVEYVSRELWETSAPDLDLTLVVPHYNAGPLLHKNIENIVQVLDEAEASFEIISVSDGSTDDSDKSLGEFGNRVKAVRLPVNRGKGQALRIGLAMGRGRYVGFIDADGDVDPHSLAEFLSLIKLYEPDIILGSKRHPLSELHYPVLRHVYSWGYQQGVRFLFHLNLRDTQTGLKLVKRDVLAQVLPRLVEKRFAFDLELFVVARLLGYTRFFEAPIRIHHQFTSTVSIRSVRGTLLDTLAIYYRLHFLRFYDETSKPIVKTDSSAESVQQQESSPFREISAQAL